MTQGFLAPRGHFFTCKGQTQTREIIELGINWVALCVNQFQENIASTRIFPDNRRTVSDRELVKQIGRLHHAGIKVMLKPMVEPLDSIWRGFIRQYTGNIIAEVKTDTVSAWFDSYRQMIRRYAEIAEETGCEMFCIGCELDGMECHDEHWRQTIAMTRDIYTGPITYNLTMNITDFVDNRSWMSLLDIVGVSGYFKVVPNDHSSSLEEMVAGWQPWKEKLQAFSKWLGKPLFFAETGARPMVGAGGITGDFWVDGAVYSEQEQTDYYLSTYRALAAEDWFYGCIWWKWDEHQHRPGYYLADGHYIGCEPTPGMQQAMRQWCSQPVGSKAPILL